MHALFETTLVILNFYQWVVLAAIVLSWLFAFNIVNRYNRVVAMIADVLEAMTEPVFRRIRRVVPNPRGIDLSPMILLIAIFFLQVLIRDDLGPIVYARY